jgi:hypothetical protein
LQHRFQMPLLLVRRKTTQVNGARGEEWLSIDDLEREHHAWNPLQTRSVVLMAGEDCFQCLVEAHHIQLALDQDSTPPPAGITLLVKSPEARLLR